MFHLSNRVNALHVFAMFVALAFLVLPSNAKATVYYKTKAEAVKNVPAHVSPKGCFVWGGGSKWMVIPGTGCAHWVAHQLNIRNGEHCYDGCSIRVRDVIAGKTAYAIANARVGDIWATATHCGIVSGLVKDKKGKVTSVNVRNCSSAAGGVVVTNFNTGSVYR